MSISREEVAKVALLARLQLSAAELQQMTDQLGRILEYVQQLDGLNTDQVQPMAHAVELTNVFADDQPHPSLARDEALANAPKRDEECYRVPAVLGD